MLSDTTNKIKIPIWMTDWYFQDKNKSKIIIRDVIMKFYKGDDVMNNPLLVNIAMSKQNRWRKNHTFKPVKVVVKSQHDFGPPYEKSEYIKAERLFNSKSRKIK